MKGIKACFIILIFTACDLENKPGDEQTVKKLPYIGSAPPSTYLYEDEQYVVVHASGGSTLQKGYPNLVEPGNILVGFKLKK